MIIAYVVASSLAAAAGIKAAHHPRLAFWRRWDPGAVRAALAAVFAIHALCGVAVAGLAFHLDWQVLDSGAGRHWANGAAYGIAAAALLRVEITSFGLSPISPARVLFHVGIELFEGWLDRGAARAVPRQLGDLRRKQLCRVSWNLYLRHVKDELTPTDALTEGRWLRATQATALARDIAPNEAIEAQERLRYFCEHLILARHDATINFPAPDDDDQRHD
jgi:hypothetical protein